jgi:hypothetical protein
MFKTKVSLVNLGLMKRYYHWFKFSPRKKKKYGKNIRQYLIKTKMHFHQVLPLKWLANANITNIVQLFRQTTYLKV